MVPNSKARGAERFRKLPRRLPMDGAYLSPGRRIWELVTLLDPVPTADAATTPLFRDARTGSIFTVGQVRETVRLQMRAIGRDGSRYGAHSLRIGGATALSFLEAPVPVIKTLGVWKSDAFLRYTRECQGQHMSYLEGICGAEVDDFEADCLDIDDDQDVGDEDFE